MNPSGDQTSEPARANVQQALYRIAELASAAHDLQEFYRAIHEWAV